MLKIQTWNENKILRTISEPLKIRELDSFIKMGREMIKYVKDPKKLWVWLAAPQIWYNKRLIVVSLLKTWKDEFFSTIIMINPEIIEFSKECDIQEEWCLSIPWKKWNIKRFLTIRVNYIDEQKKQKTLILSWPSSRIVQHEIDHLDWVLFIDKII